ncbi:transcriptional repressor LexA [Heliobacillus mobilis]|uniref:LexA repressor n=1 Tax=Heliobacterium mobile TaxID=28064 RepID=A0A6I3SN73_HELMO|nr:transcriptional repressor LexA [Heliobacterium mobile]MTV49747.1 transcriptional repressor LexA [Heliobacterium mobile]
MKLTPKEQAVYNVIKEHIREKGYPPSVREIGEQMGWASSSTVHIYLKRLEEKGYLRKDPTKPRAIELIPERQERLAEKGQEKSRLDYVQVPLVGAVAAGQPILATEYVEDYLPLSPDYLGQGDFFGLKVRGDSMIEAGIFHGDTVIVRRQPDAANGQIVVAMMDEEATVKRFYKTADHVRLQPENSAMEPIIARDVTVLGKVVAVMRRLH